MEWLVRAAESAGALIILLETGRTVTRYAGDFFRRRTLDTTMMRQRLGRSLVLGLEFLVAADILRTALAPTWEDILFLLALVGLRTALSFLLELELRYVRGGPPDGGDDEDEGAAGPANTGGK
jgi:uncharacterized membrane protein